MCQLHWLCLSKTTVYFIIQNETTLSELNNYAWTAGITWGFLSKPEHVVILYLSPNIIKCGILCFLMSVITDEHLSNFFYINKHQKYQLNQYIGLKYFGSYIESQKNQGILVISHCYFTFSLISIEIINSVSFERNRSIGKCRSPWSQTVGLGSRLFF